jgi:hypothetical protein
MKPHYRCAESMQPALPPTLLSPTLELCILRAQSGFFEVRASSIS